MPSCSVSPVIGKKKVIVILVIIVPLQFSMSFLKTKKHKVRAEHACSILAGVEAARIAWVPEHPTKAQWRRPSDCSYQNLKLNNPPTPYSVCGS